MKRILVTLTALALMVNVYAQNAEAVQKKIDKAKTATTHAKKSQSPSSWIKLGEAYLEANDLPTQGLWQNGSNMEIKLILKDQPILSTTQEEINGVVYSAENYSDKILYYTPEGTLAAWKVTKPVVENGLDLSYDAYKKAIEVDKKGSAGKDVAAALTTLKSKYTNEGMVFYTLGDNQKASYNFEKAWEISTNPLVGAIDTVMAYYTAVTSSMAGNDDNAVKFYEYCISQDYYSNGDVYASLSEIYKKKGEIEKAKTLLGDGFTKFPTNQGILVALINVYTESNDDPEKILTYLKVAQKNEPNNASLFYAEGNVYRGVNKFDEAIKCYNKAESINPKYFFAPFTEGDVYYTLALDLQTKAQDEMDDAKYTELTKQMEQALKDAIAPFERAFAVAETSDLKSAVAEYLKQIYFRFRDEKPEYQSSYEKYNEMLTTGKF